MRTIWLAQAVELKIGVTSIKIIETRHGLESNPVPTSILSFIAIIAPWGAKMDVGTGLDSRPCLVSIIFADLTSLHPPSEMIFILVYMCVCMYIYSLFAGVSF